jgi:tetratricopeptide (TPR) repeat protein
VKKPSPILALAYNFLILISVLMLILAPRPLTGLMELSSAVRFDKAGEHLAAALAYKSAAERLPWQPSLWEKAGTSALLGGNLPDAITLLTKAAARNAISKNGWVSLGLADQETGDLPSAMKAWRNALPMAEAYRYLAQGQRISGDFPAALDSWHASLLQDPQEAAAHYQVGLLEMALAPSKALPDLMRAIQLDPKLDATVQNLRGALNAALLSDDRSYQFVISGRALGASGNWDLATEAFRNAIALRADYAEAWAWLGEAKQQQGQDGSAEIERALAINPDSAMLQSLYGLYLQRQKQPEKALAAFQKAAALQPEEPGWQMALGGAYEKTGNLIAALEHYQRAVALAPGEATAWRALAEFSLRNSVDLAGTGLPAARRLVELVNNDWQADDIAGQILMENADIIGAEALLKKAVELDPTQAAPALHLGLLYLQTGNRASAYSYLSQAKVFDPDGPYGWQAKRLLEQYFP